MFEKNYMFQVPENKKSVSSSMRMQKTKQTTSLQSPII